MCKGPMLEQFMKDSGAAGKCEEEGAAKRNSYELTASPTPQLSVVLRARTQKSSKRRNVEPGKKQGRSVFSFVFTDTLK